MNSNESQPGSANINPPSISDQKQEELEEKHVEEEEEESIHGLDSDMDLEDEKYDENESVHGLDDDDSANEEKELDKLYDTLTHIPDGNGTFVMVELLTAWKLLDCSQKLSFSGWSYPSEWGQLTVPVLVYEVGLEKEEAHRFIECMDGFIKYKQKKLLQPYIQKSMKNVIS